MNHGLPPDGWDEKLEKLGGSMLQSQKWMLFQQQLGREVVYEMGDGWQWSGAVRRSHGLSYVLCGYGPVAKNEAAMSTAVMSIAEAAKVLGTDFVRIEPQAGISAEKLKAARALKIAEVDPEYTRIIDLTKNESDLRGALTSGHRNLINGTERRGITVRVSTELADFEEFLHMLEGTAKRSQVRFYPREYYQQLWQVLQPACAIRLYVAEVGERLVAAALFYDWGGTRYYAHAGAYQDVNRKVKASVSLVWQAILDAKANGLHSFDMGGIAPEGDKEHHLAVLSTFKNAFGGEPVSYLGTWDIPVRPAKYRAYQLYRRLKGRT